VWRSLYGVHVPSKRSIDAGAALERAIRDDLPANVELDPREELLLAAAAKQADDIAALEADVRGRGHVLDGGGLNPSVREARQGRLALGRLLAGIDVPAGASATTLRAERAARERWRRAG
jgi:hypothetical protein